MPRTAEHRVALLADARLGGERREQLHRLGGRAVFAVVKKDVAHLQAVLVESCRLLFEEGAHVHVFHRLKVPLQRGPCWGRHEGRKFRRCMVTNNHDPEERIGRPHGSIPFGPAGERTGRGAAAVPAGSPIMPLVASFPRVALPSRPRAAGAKLTILCICACFGEQAWAALALLAHGTQGFALSTTLPSQMGKFCAAATAAPRLRPQFRAGRRAATSPALHMQFGLGNLFGGGGGGAKGKVVSLEEAGVVPDVSSRPCASQALVRWADPDPMNDFQQIIAEPFESKTVLRVKYPAWVKSAVDLKDVSSFGGTPTRGAGEIGMGQVM